MTAHESNAVARRARGIGAPQARRARPAIERWTNPRKSYPEGRAAMLQWPPGPQDSFHSRRVGEINADGRYDADDIARRRAGGEKSGQARRRGADAGRRSCIVFLAFLRRSLMQKSDDDKLAGILAKPGQDVIAGHGMRNASRCRRACWRCSNKDWRVSVAVQKSRIIPGP